MKGLLLCALLFYLQMYCSKIWIVKLNAWRVVQIQKSYGPESHILTKSSTPSMGGVVFILVALASIPLVSLFSGSGMLETTLFWILPFGAAAIGFFDDWIKFSRKSSEGFPSLYKLGAQLLLVVPWSYWMAFKRGIFLWPGFELPMVIAAPLLAVFAIGMLNAVNVTDGLDGLASGAALISFVGACLWLEPGESLFYASLAGVAICAGFLWHNAHPAKVFMGDVGSHFLAGMIVTLCVYGKSLVAFFPLGFLFGIEIFSVTAQLIAIHFFKRKIFRMSPLHHHFELLGWSETQIVIRFWMIHGAGLTLLAVVLNGLF